jgi:hypothetical protein
MNIDLGDGNDRIHLRSLGIAAVDTVLAAGDGDDDVSIALLLPAVQKVAASVATTHIDLGPGADRLRLQIRGYESVDTTIIQDDEDTIISRGPRNVRPPVR